MVHIPKDIFRQHPAYTATQLDADDRLRLLAAAVDALQVSVVITEAELNPPGPRILYANPAFTTLSGWLPEDLAGRSPRILQGPASDRRVLDRLRDDLENGRVFFGETMNYKKDGTPFVMEWQISPITDRAGEVVFFVAVQLDRTERRRLEEIAEAVNMMDQVGFLFGSLRHELANPVSSVKTALHVLRENAERYGPADVQRFVGLMEEDLGRVEYLLDALRSFNRFEHPRLEPLDLAAFLRRFRDLLANDGSGLAVTLDLRAGEAHVLADPRALHQVLLNLVTNARDANAGRPGGRIDLVLEKKGRYFDLEVRDGGVGMSQAQLKNLFRPFYTDKPRGTGLGLVIVKKLISGMGGTIAVESQPDLGSCFRVSLEAVPSKP